MPLLTLAQARISLFKYASNVPYASSTAAEKLSVDTVINQVCERFLTSGKWRNTVVRATLPVYDQQVTLPSSLQTILGVVPIEYASDGSACRSAPLAVYGPYYDFVTYGGPCATCGLVDLGESWPTFIDPPYEIFRIRIAPELTETATILLRGLDEDGHIIFTAPSTEGISASLAAGSTPAQQFTLFSYWVKSAPTNGVVRLYAVDVATGAEGLITTITPGKTVSGYRRYRVPWAADGDLIEIIAKRAFVNAVSDNDAVYPSHTGALKLAMMSLQFEDKNDMDRADEFMERALTLLDADRQEFDGDNVIPTIKFVGDYGAGSIVNVM